MIKVVVFCVAILTSWSCVGAATSAIGTASARGNMRIDGSLVSGNATLFDGTVVETDAATTALRLGQGVEIRLATDSRGKLYRDRLLLEKGSGELVRAGGFELDAKRVKITPDSPNARGVVSMDDANTVKVEALSGGLRVTTGNGILLAKIEPGRAMEFSDSEAGAAAPTTVTGKLTKEGDACTPGTEQKYFLTVAGTGLKYQVTGEGLEKLVGKTVTLTGTVDPSVSASHCAAGLIVAASAPTVGGSGGGADRAASAGGMTAKTKLIIAGVVVAGAVGTGVGIYEANQSPSPASR